MTRSGEERLIEWPLTARCRDGQGRVIGTFSSGTDITARDQAVEALRIAEERMRFALEAASVGIWDMNYATATLAWSRILEEQHRSEASAPLAGPTTTSPRACIRRIGRSSLPPLPARHNPVATFRAMHPHALARWDRAVAQRRRPDHSRPQWRSRFAASALPATSPAAARSKRNISRRRRWRPSGATGRRRCARLQQPADP